MTEINHRNVLIGGGIVGLLSITIVFGWVYVILIGFAAAGASGFYAYRQNETARRCRLTAVTHGRKVSRMGQESSAKSRGVERKLAGPRSPWSTPVGEDSRNRSRFAQGSAGSFLSSPSLPRVKRLHNNSLDMSPGRASMTSQRHYPTHQPQFGGVGILPSVHLQPTLRTVLGEHNSSMVHKPVTVKIAPPSNNCSFLQSPRVTCMDDSMQLSSDDPCDTETVVTALREKRKRNLRDDEGTPSSLGQVNKRRKHGQGDKGDQPIVPNGGVHMDISQVPTTNLKRPALSRGRRDSASTEHEDSPKRLKQETPQSGGSTKRNPIEMSYSSSRRWLEKQVQMTTPEVPARETRSRSKSREPSRSRETSGARQLQPSQQESHRKKGNVPRLEVDQDVVMEERPVGEQSAETDTPGTPLLEQNGKEEEQETVVETPKKKLFPLAKESSARRRQTPIYSSLTNSFNKVPQLQQCLTVEDYDRDRQANLERVQTMLQEVEEAHRQKTGKSETAPVASTSASSDKSLAIVGSTASTVTPTSAVTATTTTQSVFSSSIKVNLTSTNSGLQKQPTARALTSLNQSSDATDLTTKGQNTSSQSETATSSVKNQPLGGLTFPSTGQSSSVAPLKPVAGDTPSIASLLSSEDSSKNSTAITTPPASGGFNFQVPQTSDITQTAVQTPSSVTNGDTAPPPYPSSTSSSRSQQQISFSPVFGGNTTATASSTGTETKNSSEGISTSGLTSHLSSNLSPIMSPVGETSTQSSVKFGVPESVSAAVNLATLSSPGAASAVTNTLLNTNKFGVQVSGQTTPQPGGPVGGFSFGNKPTVPSTNGVQVSGQTNPQPGGPIGGFSFGNNPTVSSTNGNFGSTFSFDQKTTQNQQLSGLSANVAANPVTSTLFASGSQTSTINSSFSKEKSVSGSNSNTNFTFGSNASAGASSGTGAFQFNAGSSAQNTGQSGTTSTFVFGQTATPTASVFGQNKAGTPASTSILAFGQSSGPGATAFGQTGSSTNTTTTASIFGKNTASYAGVYQFGGSDAGRTVPSGGTQAVQFGSGASANNAPSFNFGTQNATSAQSVFGASSSASGSMFGSTNTNTNTNNPAPFGSKLPQPFGNTGVFGSQNPAPSFGQNTQDSSSGLNKALLSTPPSKNPFGSNPSQNAFGAPVKQNPKDQSQAQKGFDFTSSTRSSGSAFTFGGSSSTGQQQQQQQQTSSAFVFGQTNQGQNSAGSFNFSAGSTPAFGNSAPAGPPPQFAAPQTSSSGSVFGQQQQGAASGMFSIGSGSTAPRMRNSTRMRRRPPKR